MARLDRRIFPFLEMLAELDLDWLAFEIVDGIERGVEPLEPDEALAEARMRARAGEPPSVERGSGRRDTKSEAKPMLGEEQLIWVAGHVERRLDETFAEAIVSLQNLDAIINNRREAKSTRATTTLVILDGDDTSSLDLRRAEEARHHLETLKGSLADWLTSTRGETAK